MANCTYCGTETQLFSSGVPICLACSDDLEAGRKPPRPQAPASEPEKLAASAGSPATNS